MVDCGSKAVWVMLPSLPHHHCAGGQRFTYLTSFSLIPPTSIILQENSYPWSTRVFSRIYQGTKYIIGQLSDSFIRWLIDWLIDWLDLKIYFFRIRRCWALNPRSQWISCRESRSSRWADPPPLFSLRSLQRDC